MGGVWGGCGGGGGGGGGLNNVLAAAPLLDSFHTTGQASCNLPILF